MTMDLDTDIETLRKALTGRGDISDVDYDAMVEASINLLKGALTDLHSLADSLRLIANAPRQYQVTTDAHDPLKDTLWPLNR